MPYVICKLFFIFIRLFLLAIIDMSTFILSGLSLVVMPGTYQVFIHIV